MGAVSRAVGLAALCITAGLLAACAAAAPLPRRIVLIAPFEGVHRSLGYQALYAARLALAPYTTGPGALELLPLDDGGSPERARLRAQAAARDPQVAAALALGPNIGGGDVQTAWADVPVVIVGAWAAECAAPSVRILASREAIDRFTLPPDSGVEALAAVPGRLVGGEMLALPEFARLRAALIANGDAAEVEMLTSADAPDADYAAAYTASDTFAPPPAVFAPLVTDAAAWAAEAARADNRAGVLAALDAGFAGRWHTWTVNGDGCFSDLPARTYRFSGDGMWTESPAG